MTYDQWKTTDPADYHAAVCERCGGYLRGLWRDECPDCDDELLAEEAMLEFYQWEPFEALRASLAERSGT